MISRFLRFALFLIFSVIVLALSTAAVFAGTEGGEPDSQIGIEGIPTEGETLITCPVDDTKFTYRLKVIPEGHIVEDRDFGLRLIPDLDSLRTIDLYHAKLAVCPTCGYVAPPDSVLWRGNPDAVDWYRETYIDEEGGRNPALDATPWEDFGRMAMLLESAGASERDRALAWLDASFSLRTAFWQEYVWWEHDSFGAFGSLDPHGSLGVSPPTPLELYEESIEFPGYFLELLEHPESAYPSLSILALYWLAKGESARVRHTLNASGVIEDERDGEESGDGRRLIDQIEESGLVEKMREYQSKAITEFEAALTLGQVTAGEVPLVYYHLGELSRRVGEVDNAERYYRLVLASPAASPDLDARASSGIGLLEEERTLYESLTESLASAVTPEPEPDVANEVETAAEAEIEEEVVEEPPRLVGDAIRIK